MNLASFSGYRAGPSQTPISFRTCSRCGVPSLADATRRTKLQELLAREADTPNTSKRQAHIVLANLYKASRRHFSISMVLLATSARCHTTKSFEMEAVADVN